MAPVVRYLEREESIDVAQSEGRDLIFLRPTAMVDTSIGGAIFQGRAGIVRERHGRRSAQALDAARLELADHPDRKIREL